VKNPEKQETTRGREKAQAPSANERDRRALIARGLIPALLAFLSALAFFPALQNEFVNWDDYHTLVMNPHYQGLGLTQLQWMFTTFYLGHYQPLSWITWSLDYLVWGQNPFGYHLTNLVIHSANAVLFYFIGWRLLELASPRSEREEYLTIPVAAACATLLFAAHPLRVESVAWITERRDLLSAHFLFWTLICYFRAAASRDAGFAGRRWLWGALVFYVLSLLSKAWGMTLPVLLCVLDVYPLRRLEGNPVRWLSRGYRNILIEKLPFAVLAIIFAFLAVFAQESAGAMASWEGYPLPRRIAQAFYGIVFYLWKTLWPVDLSPLYHVHYRFNYLALPFLASAAVVLAITLALFAMRRRWPAGLAAWVCYIVLLSPVLGFTQSGFQFVADRYSYLSCLSWALLAGAALLSMLRNRGVLSGAYHRLSLAGTTGVVLIALGALTWKYTLVWRSSETLWRHAIATNPQSNLAHLYFGMILKLQNKLPEAVEHYQRALQIDPDNAEVYFHMAEALAGLGELDRAIEYLRKYIQKAPPTAALHVNLGIYLGWQGKTDEESSEYRRALEIDPKSADAYYGLGNNLAARGELEEAKKHYLRAIELNPQKSEFHFNLGNLLVKQNLLDQATESFRQAIRVKPRFPLARNNLGRLLAARGDLAGAMEQFREALRVDPAFAPAHESMAQLLAQLGRREEAMEHYREALRLTQPGAGPGAQR
jgi:tetratricopeptide (TPR) repeat protein